MGSPTKLFVGSLPPTIVEQTFRDLFEPYGTIVSLVCSGEKRYGFVTYSDYEEANVAMGAMNGYGFEGCSLVVKLADNQGVPGAPTGAGAVVPGGAAVAQQWGADANGGVVAGGMGAVAQSDRIYVKGLPAGATEDLLNNIFGLYGAVLDAKVLVADGESSDGTGQSVAIVRMGSVEEAQWLVDNLHGNIPQGLTRVVEVSFAGKRPQQGKGAAANRYSPYGNGAGVAAAAPVMTGGPVQVPVAGGVLQLPGLAGGGPRPTPTFASPVAQYGQGGGAPQGGGGARGAARDALIPGLAQLVDDAGPGSLLYVKGLPPHADDLYLYKVFAPFGCVLTAKAVHKEGYVIGFVQFGTPLEAQGAIDAVNGQQLLDGTVLGVSIKMSKQG
mmetsp:Transcript_61513/g.133110  ORF Transcript_61513/g.133110 Transcript_61513/m.133110 type:complete len:385 (-) Transcript_61513:66-1220(-)